MSERRLLSVKSRQGLAHGWTDAATATDDLVSRCHGWYRATGVMDDKERQTCEA